jgi:hypothetical protein
MAIIRTAGATAGIAVAARATSQAEMAPSTASASTACKFRRIVDSLGANRAQPEPDPHTHRQVVGPLGDRGERTRPSQYGADPDRQDRDEPMPHTAARPRIRHRRQRPEQISRGGDHLDWRRPELVDDIKDRRR